MGNRKNRWLTISLVNLCIVALLGVTLRSKILFPLQGIDFTHILHAHSHFAFCGWITLALMTLMIYEILPASLHNRKYYQWLLSGVLLNAVGMLIAFFFQGYAFFSILFSTLFVFVTYAFTYVFIRDVLRSGTEKAVSILSLSAVVCLALSSVGPFSLAFMMAYHSSNHFMYRDSVYTYLHLQYNGFFTLSVFALLFNSLYKKFDRYQLGKARRFAAMVSISILPTLFISYLWHFSNLWVKAVALLGCILIMGSIILLLQTLRAVKDQFGVIAPFTKIVASLSIIAFLLKSLLQTGTIYHPLGVLVYGDRAIIIGYLHLVLLGFISLYLLAHMLHNGTLNVSTRPTRYALRVFIGAVVTNEAVLMIQGFGNMLMLSMSLYTWLLWLISIWLFAGAVFIVVTRLKYGNKTPDL